MKFILPIICLFSFACHKDEPKVEVPPSPAPKAMPSPEIMKEKKAEKPQVKKK